MPFLNIQIYLKKLQLHQMVADTIFLIVQPQRRPAKGGISVYSDKSKMNITATNENIVPTKATGLNGRAKRATFTDLSNSMKATVLTDKKVDGVAAGPNKQMASQPALRAQALQKSNNSSAPLSNNASFASGVKVHQPMGSKINVPKTTFVYQDKPAESSNVAPLRKENPQPAKEDEKQAVVAKASEESIPDVAKAEEKAIYSYTVNEDMKVGVVETIVDSDGTEPDAESVEDEDHASDSDEEDDDKDAPLTTTSGITVTLFPRTTAKDRKELEAAEHRFAADDGNDMEDNEDWDITMVQEYCKEIFDHFKDMEVFTLWKCFFFQKCYSISLI